ncbi:hypothetical protein N431DRAFT_39250 [Stipitochalara longipes BDJ]|nr:hypothetical protein N431DRAFT_39250 [Stipitochalara longipes BDJ]
MRSESWTPFSPKNGTKLNCHLAGIILSNVLPSHYPAEGLEESTSESQRSKTTSMSEVAEKPRVRLPFSISDARRLTLAAKFKAIRYHIRPRINFLVSVLRILEHNFLQRPQAIHEHLYVLVFGIGTLSVVSLKAESTQVSEGLINPSMCKFL